VSTVPFDTYRFARRLIDAGMDEKQARELVDGATDAAEQLATKQDLKALEQSLTLKLGGIVAGVASLLFAALKVFS
jgi:hypothetical protein